MGFTVRRSRRPIGPRGVVALVILVLFAPSGAAAAQRPVARTALSDVEQEVMCPTCGTPLMVAESPLADRERAFIRTRIARGETKEQIKRDMVAEFGPDVLATPAGRGFDLSAYLVPASGVALALIGLSLALTRWRRRGPERDDPSTPAPELSAGVSRRLDDDLARYDL